MILPYIFGVPISTHMGCGHLGVGLGLVYLIFLVFEPVLTPIFFRF
jgi:hypothetical protein